MTSLNIHSHGFGPFALEVSPSGCFWDAGSFDGGYSDDDHWSMRAMTSSPTLSDASPSSDAGDRGPVAQLPERDSQ
jgi:hypothetical protein